MEISLIWRTPVPLREAPKDLAQDYTLSAPDEERIPEGPGIYVFARRFGSSYGPMYIGQAENLRQRIIQHLKTNVALMRSLRNAQNGGRSILIAEIQTRQGQRVSRVLSIVERTLIAEAVAAGYNLVNKQLTSARFHTIQLNGPKAARGPFLPSYSIPIT